jgi:hypothetical protein
MILFPDMHTASMSAKSLASDGQFLYLYTSKGLFKIGSGYGGTIKGHVYLHKTDFHADDRGWLGYANVSISNFYLTFILIYYTMSFKETMILTILFVDLTEIK